jgi:hypothetical protein
MLPQFEVLAVEEDRSELVITGQFEELRGVREGLSWLLPREERSVVGRTENLLPTRRTATFRVHRSDWDPSIRIGRVLPWLDGYWDVRQIWLVLDRRRHWTLRPFVESDARVLEWKGRRAIGPVDQAVPEGATTSGTLPGGWDHEHCGICQTTIGHGGDPDGFADDEGHWVCRKCFTRYVQRHDISFVWE